MEDLSTHQKIQLSLLLEKKLAGIPAGHLPTISLADVVGQTPKALKLPNIPSDLQLAFVLQNRAQIDAQGGRAIKDEQEQHLDITRAIFFYRIDTAHQFQRYHDSSRWNLAMFIAILSTPHFTDTNVRDGAYFSLAARRFVMRYLDAVLEAHNTPELFSKREIFVDHWKASSYDFFTFVASQKRVLKAEMKRLSKGWENELDRIQTEMGTVAYKARVARFVGSLVPGRQDQRPACGRPRVESEERDTIMEGKNVSKKETLLAALSEPLGSSIQQHDVQSSNAQNVGRETSMVADIRAAISAVQKSEPRIMLETLLSLFPQDEYI